MSEKLPPLSSESLSRENLVFIVFEAVVIEPIAGDLATQSSNACTVGRPTPVTLARSRRGGDIIKVLESYAITLDYKEQRLIGREFESDTLVLPSPIARIHFHVNGIDGIFIAARLTICDGVFQVPSFGMCQKKPRR